MFSCSELLPFCRSLLKSSLQIRMCKPGGKKKNNSVAPRPKNSWHQNTSKTRTQAFPAEKVCKPKGCLQGCRRATSATALEATRVTAGGSYRVAGKRATSCLDRCHQRKPPKVTTQKLQEIQTGWREQFCSKGKPLARQVQAHSFTSFKD